MKKWLVGLLAASLCVASAWATDDVLTNTDVGGPNTSYVDWTATTKPSGAEYAGQSAGGPATNPCIQLRSKNSNSGIVMTKGSGKNVSSVTIEWNAQSAASRVVQVYGSTTAYTAPSDLYGDNAGTLLGAVTNGADVTSVDVAAAGDYPFIGIRSKSDALYLTSVTVSFDDAPAGLAIALDPADDFDVEQGEEGRTITATVTGAQGEVVYAWSVNGSPIDLAGNVYSIDSTEIAGPFEVVCEAQDEESNDPVSASVTYSVVAAKPSFAINLADTIEGGDIGADKEQAKEGETVTLSYEAAEGYKFVKFIVDGDDLSGDTFTMPAKDVFVTAEFMLKPVVAGFTKITSLDELTEGEYVITGAKAAGEEYAMMASIAGTSTKYIERRAEAVTIEDENTVTDAEDSIIWTLAQGENGWTIYNEAVGYAGYVASGNSSGAETNASAKSSWTITASETAGLFLLENVDKAGRYLLYNSGSPRFACYTNLTSGKHLALYKGSSGPAPLRVSLDQENPLRLDVGTGASVTATATGGEKPYTFAWECSTAPELNGAGETLAIPDTLGLGTNTVWLTVSDSSDPAREIMQAFVVVVQEPAVPHDVKIAVGIQGGVVTADPEQATVGETVTLTATPADGKKLESMTVTYGGGETTLTFTSSPAEFEMPDEDVYVGATFVDKPAVAGFTKITSLDELTEGEYVITGAKAAGEEYAMMASIAGTSTKYIERRAEAVTIEEENTVTDAEDSIIWTLAQGENGWTIYNEAVGYAGYVASGNSAGAETNASAKSSWTITASTNAGLFLLNNVDKDGRYLLYNASSPRFACYTNLTSGKHLALYKGSSGPAPLRVSLDQENPLRLDVGTGASVTATATGGEKPYTFTWECSTAPELNGTGETLAIPDTLGLGTNTVWLTVSDSSDPAREIMQAFVVVVQAPPQSYTVEVADGIQNGTVEISVGGEIVASPATVPEGTTVTLIPVPVNRSYKLGSISVKTDGGQDVELDAHYSFTMPSDNVTVYAQFVENVITAYTRISSLNDLVPGKYLLVADGFDQAMSSDLGTASTKRWQAVDVTIATVDDVTTAEFDDDAVVWTLAQDGDNWTLYNEEASKYAAAATSAGNSGTMVDAVTDYARWTISCTDGIFKFASVGQSGRYIQRNNTADNAYFATYTGSAKNIRLFQGEKSGPVAPSVSGTVPTSANIHEAISVIFELKNGTATGWTASLGEIDSTGAWSWTPTEAKAYTLTVTATYDGGSATKDYPIEVVDPSSFDQYTLVTSVDELEDGQYLVVGTKDDTAYAMTAGLSKVLSGTEVTISQDDEVEYILNNDASLVWTVSVDDVTGFMSFYNATDKYIGYDSTKNANELYSFAEASEATSWAAAKDEETGLFQLTCGVHDKDDAVRNLQFNYNSGNVRFSGYKGTQQDVKLFKLGSSSPAISGPSSIEGYVGDELTGTFFVRNLGELTVVDWSADQGEIADGVWTLADATEGSFTLEVTATLSDGTPLTKSVEVTVSQAPVAYAITVNAVGCTVDAPATAYAGDTVNLTVTPAANYELKDITVNGVSQGTTTSFVMPAQDTTVTVTCEALPGVPTLTCTEGTSLTAKVNQALVLHFTLANAEFYTDEGPDGILEDGNDDADGVFSDFTATSFTWTWTPSATGSYDFHFNAVDGDYEYIVEDYPLTVEVSEGGGEAGEVTFVSMQKVDGVWTFTLSDGTTRTADSADIWYSTDLVTWIQNTGDTKADLTAPAIFLKVAP